MVELSQGFSALAGEREALYAFVARGELASARPAKRVYFEGDWHCKGPPLDAFGAWLSARGPVAYVETNYFGGAGDQGACAWRGGVRIYGPRRGLGDDGVINEALVAIGVVPERGDAFDALGLGAWRSNEAVKPAGEHPPGASAASWGRPRLTPRPGGPTIRRPGSR